MASHKPGPSRSTVLEPQTPSPSRPHPPPPSSPAADAVADLRALLADGTLVLAPAPRAKRWGKSVVTNGPTFDAAAKLAAVLRRLDESTAAAPPELLLQLDALTAENELLRNTTTPSPSRRADDADRARRAAEAALVEEREAATRLRADLLAARAEIETLKEAAACARSGGFTSTASTAEIAALRADNARLTTETADLRRQLAGRQGGASTAAKDADLAVARAEAAGLWGQVRQAKERAGEAATAAADVVRLLSNV